MGNPEDSNSSLCSLVLMGNCMFLLVDCILFLPTLIERSVCFHFFSS